MSLEPKLLQARRLVQAKEAEMQAAEAATDKALQRCERALTRLGAEKARVMEEGLIPFHDAFSRLQNVRLQIELAEEGAPEIDEVVVAAAGRLTGSVMDLVGATAVAGAASATAYGATVTAVGALATASTGTAISSLSGAAATNATLAWLGGGSLAAGGGGVAVGTAVLGDRRCARGCRGRHVPAPQRSAGDRQGRDVRLRRRRGCRRAPAATLAPTGGDEDVRRHPEAAPRPTSGVASRDGVARPQDEEGDGLASA